MKVSILGTAATQTEPVQAWLQQALEGFVRWVQGQGGADLHVGCQRATGAAAVAVAEALDLACQLYHPIAGRSANLETWLPPIHCSPWNAPVNGHTYRKYAQQVLDAGDVRCIVFSAQGPSRHYAMQAIETGKPVYLIKLDTFEADWITP